MKVSELYTYPIKSLRPQSLDSTELTQHGFRYDRRFMLLKATTANDGGTSLENMHVAEYAEMVLFHPKLHPPSGPGSRDGKIVVTFKPPDRQRTTIEVPLEPATEDLEAIEVDMHHSKTKAYKMDIEYNKWFSNCFGFDVVLAYLGGYHRSVLMSTPQMQRRDGLSTGWLASISTFFLGEEAEEQQITFADCAPYLVVSERSMDDVHNRLPEGQLMDITKFRPNIIISGANEAWEEDFWGEITIGRGTKIECIHNCARCKSINIDFATGRPGTTESGKMLAKLQSNRRVDPGTKYSPVFGRYSFLHPSSEGHHVRVGDEVTVSVQNLKRTVFGKGDVEYRLPTAADKVPDWAGLATP